MKRFATKFVGSLAGALLVLATMASPTRLMAQDVPPASIYGKVTNPAGMAVNDGEVRLTTDRSNTTPAKDRKFEYTFPVDATGNYKGSGVKPGTYVVMYFEKGQSVDFIDNVILASGDNKQVDIDMTRKEYMDSLSPDQRKQIEEFKKNNAAAVKANSQIANLNAALTQARADIKAGNFDPAVSSMQQATSQKPDEPILWVTLGDAQIGAADKARGGTKTITDQAVIQKYNDAIASYKKGVDLSTASKKPSPETIAAAENQIGIAYGRLGDGQNSSAAFDAAAKAIPANAGMYYFNEAVTLYNAGKLDEAAAAADKAIAADPKRADAYYIKGQSLIPKATVDPKTQKIVAPPGCVEAYQQYLEEAPDGPHAQEVKDILTGIGAEVKSSYKATKSKKK